MLRRLLIGLTLTGAIGAALVTYWVATPSDAPMAVPAPLTAWTPSASPPAGSYDGDMKSLTAAFRPQTYRSFCGPASMATVLRAYGKDADQKTVVPSTLWKLKVFYSGMSLAELGSLAQRSGLRGRVVYADTIDTAEFRELVKSNLSRPGDFVLINYDRKALKQAGAGHISPIAAYDSTRDAFLILDEASYRYPFTWVPTQLLYAAARTRADDHYRGLLLIEGVTSN